MPYTSTKSKKRNDVMVRPIIYSENFIKMVDTIDALIPLMNDIVTNLLKARGGNQAAAQRARKATIVFEKKAKLFRKYSVKKQNSKDL